MKVEDLFFIWRFNVNKTFLYIRRYEFNLKTTIFILTVKFDLFIIFTYEFKLFLAL